MVGNIILIFYMFCFVFLWIRHFYLVHIKLNKYMNKYHFSKWSVMKNDTGWYRPVWASFYFSKGIYGFVWKSEEDFNDVNIVKLRKSIKLFVWELVLFFGGTVLTSILLIWLDIL